MHSSIARKILSLYYRPGKIYRVLFGPSRGTKMYFDKTVQFHVILGLCEIDNFLILEKMLGFLKNKKTSLTACDVGANIGMISIWLSKNLSISDRVICFEPSPAPIKIIRQNILINQTKNVVLVTEACSDRVGTVDFYIGNHHVQSSLHSDWAGENRLVPEKITVNTTTLDNYFVQKGLEFPDLIKFDIEGGGTHALLGCKRCVTEKRPLILIESHTPEEDKAICNLITENDYQAYRVTNKSWVKNRDKTHPDSNGVWGTLFLCPSEHYVYFNEKLM